MRSGVAEVGRNRRHSRSARALGDRGSATGRPVDNTAWVSSVNSPLRAGWVGDRQSTPLYAALAGWLQLTALGLRLHQMTLSGTLRPGGLASSSGLVRAIDLLD